MEDFIFHEGALPSGFRLEFEEAIFNQLQHRSLQSAEGWYSFYVLNKKKKKVNASIHFHIVNGVAKSPLRNPFGSFEFSDSLRPIVLFLFIEFIEAQLISKGVCHVILKMPPESHQPDHAALLQTFLFNHNFHVAFAEVATGIPVSKNKFENLLHRSERRKLEKAKAARLSFKEVSTDKLPEIYSFIEQCRHAKEYSLSLSQADLERTVKIFKNDYKFFATFHKKQIIAASIAIRVKQDILYDFYHDHDSSFDHLSPIVFLVQGIYKYCNQEKIKLLDLGTSALEATPNFGLLNFKVKLGAKPCAKLTFEKILT